MPPFLPPNAVVKGFKERVESLAVQGDRLYVGTATGTLHVFSIDHTEGNGLSSTLVSSKSISRKPIEQIGFVKDTNSLVVLADSIVTLYPIPSLVPPAPLTQARYAYSFAVNSSVRHNSPDNPFDSPTPRKAGGIPTIITHLAIGCRRRIVIYQWKDGEAPEVKELTLAHSPRTIVFANDSVLCLAYSATEHVMLYLETMSLADLTFPPRTALSGSTIGGMGMGALSGLSGYMTLGLSAKAKPLVLSLGNEEIIVPKDNSGVVIGADSKASRTETLEWHSFPEDLALVKPYIIMSLPPGSAQEEAYSSNPKDASAKPSYSIHAVSSLNLQSVQTIPFPFTTDPSNTRHPNQILRLITPSPSAKSPFFVVSTPIERGPAAAEGSTIWAFNMTTWTEQLDELILTRAYGDALALLHVVLKGEIPDKDAIEKRIRILEAVAKFKHGKWDSAIDTFLELDVNPAKVVALYPESVSGRLFTPQDRWIPLFGGPEPAVPPAQEDAPVTVEVKAASPPNSVSTTLAATVSAILPSQVNEDDTASMSAAPKKPSVDPMKKSVEALIRFLSDHRPKVKALLESVQITPSKSHQYPSLSEVPVEELMTLPNAPISILTPEQLLRFAQIVDTALFKSYLTIRPGLLGPLCRLENWCEVTEMEEVLQEHKKFAELIFLYNGKKMHSKALALLKRLSEDETDMRDKLEPTVTYLRKLGPEFIDQIFESSRWVFQQDSEIGLEIFTSEETELPRSAVTDFLEEIDQKICARYLEFLIQEREEESTLFHDRLAELYLDMSRTYRKGKQSGDDPYPKLLHFIETSDRFRIDRLFGLLPSDDMFEARAVLLGRMDKHDAALETYVYRLRDYVKAEEYCKQVYKQGTPTEGVFLTLLEVYLRSPERHSSDLLQPALALISRQRHRLDSIATLNLLPPLVAAQDVREFLCEALNQPTFDTRVIRAIGKARTDQLSKQLLTLESKRVKIADSRICPQCHKRIGNSVIAVHVPRGEVTHYQCREAFAQKLRHEDHSIVQPISGLVLQ